MSKIWSVLNLKKKKRVEEGKEFKKESGHLPRATTCWRGKELSHWPSGRVHSSVVTWLPLESPPAGVPNFWDLMPDGVR